MPGLFDGITMWVEGTFSSYTVNGVKRLIDDNGGTLARAVDKDMPTHFIISGQLWNREHTQTPSLLIKNIKAANKANANADDSDDDSERTWILSLDWILVSIEKGKRQAEAEFDWEKVEKVRKQRKKSGSCHLPSAERPSVAPEEPKIKKAFKNQDAVVKHHQEGQKLGTSAAYGASEARSVTAAAAATAQFLWRDVMSNAASRRLTEVNEPSSALKSAESVKRAASPVEDGERCKKAKTVENGLP